MVTHFTCPIGHVRPFSTFATHLVCEQENIIVTFIVTPDALDKTRREVSRQLLDKSSENSKAFQRIRYMLKAVQCMGSILILSVLALEEFSRHACTLPMILSDRSNSE